MSFYIQRADELKQIKEEKIKERHFVMTFCGVFSSGKSSMINCLLDYKYLSLPTGINPLTKLITRIEYGEKLSFFYKRGSKKIFLTEKEFNAMITGEITVPKYCNQINIEIPAKILKNGIVFLDTPGFEDEMGAEFETMSRDAIMQSDFVVVCTSALQFGDMFERELIDELQEKIKNFVLVVNRIDCLNIEKDFESIKKRVTKTMGDKGTELCKEIFKENIFYTVADGRVKKVSEFSSAMARLSENYSLKREIKNNTFKNIQKIKYRALIGKIEDDLSGATDCCERQKQLIEKIRQDIAMHNLEVKQKRQTKLISCETVLNSTLGDIRKDINQLEAENKHASFVEDTKNLLKKHVKTLALQIKSHISCDLSDIFLNIITNQAIPEPVAQRMQSKGVAEKIFNGFMEWFVDADFMIIYKNYANKAIQVVDSSIKPKLLNTIKTAIEKECGELMDESTIFPYESELAEMEKDIENLQKLKENISSLVEV
ncbi:MAG: dynamin family protein [Clostridia bacterium]|nr:dynamin family protein [Clostridia bacterium]